MIKSDILKFTSAFQLLENFGTYHKLGKVNTSCVILIHCINQLISAVTLQLLFWILYIFAFQTNKESLICMNACIQQWFYGWENWFMSSRCQCWLYINSNFVFHSQIWILRRIIHFSFFLIESSCLAHWTQNKAWFNSQLSPANKYWTESPPGFSLHE